MILRKLSKIQNNTGKQLNKMNKTIHDLNDKFNKEMETKNIKEPNPNLGDPQFNQLKKYN